MRAQSTKGQLYLSWNCFYHELSLRHDVFLVFGKELPQLGGRKSHPGVFVHQIKDQTFENITIVHVLGPLLPPASESSHAEGFVLEIIDLGTLL